MSSIRSRIRAFAHADLNFDWSGKASLHVPMPAGGFSGQHDLDPTPGYAHDAGLVAEVAALCEGRFPTLMPTIYALLPVDTQSRTNGWCEKNYQYGSGKKPYPFASLIVLAGKRIPLHPAMTRYLVAHEYGHAADYHLCFRLGLEDNGLDEEYARMRGIGCDSRYGPGKWHTNIGEVIANDFRISVCGVEREFWPHPYDHPDRVPAVGAWWSEMMLKYVDAPARIVEPCAMIDSGAMENVSGKV